MNYTAEAYHQKLTEKVSMLVDIHIDFMNLLKIHGDFLIEEMITFHKADDIKKKYMIDLYEEITPELLSLRKRFFDALKNENTFALDIVKHRVTITSFSRYFDAADKEFWEERFIKNYLRAYDAFEALRNVFRTGHIISSNYYKDS